MPSTCEIFRRFCILLVWYQGFATSQELLLLGDSSSATAPKQEGTSKLRQKADQDEVVSYPLDSLQNVTGVFRGQWKNNADGRKHSAVSGLDNDAGMLHFKLYDTYQKNASLHTIQGDLKLRNGFHNENDDDIEFTIDGVFIEDLGRVLAFATTTDPAMTQQLETAEYEQQSPAYRRALSKLTGKYLEYADLIRRTRGMPGGGFLISGEESFTADFLKLTKTCELLLDLKVSLPNISDSADQEVQDAPRQAYILLNGTATSSDCGISLEIGAKSTHLDLFISKATKYTIFVTTITFIQIWLLSKQASASNTQAQMSSVSMLMMGQQAVIDAVLCLAHLSSGVMIEPMFNAFATTAFLEFILFAVFEMRFILNIWRARRSPHMDLRTQQRQLLTLYIRFYLALLVSIFFSYRLQRFIKVVVFAALAMWVPQIVLCAYQDARQPLRAFYLWSMSAFRFLLPLYFFLCPNNILQVKASPRYCVALGVWLCVQVLFLSAQTRFGPRFFIPKRFLPAKYDYFRTLTAQQIAESPKASDIETGDAGHECVICMNPIDLTINSARMITPCNHYFHPGCLQRWMLVKMECPTCRSALPPE